MRQMAAGQNKRTRAGEYHLLSAQGGKLLKSNTCCEFWRMRLMPVKAKYDQEVDVPRIRFSTVAQEG
jgi:hypothetical protein